MKPLYATPTKNLLAGELKDPVGQPVNDATFEIRHSNETLPGYLGQGKFSVYLPDGNTACASPTAVEPL